MAVSRTRDVTPGRTDGDLKGIRRLLALLRVVRSCSGCMSERGCSKKHPSIGEIREECVTREHVE